MTLYKCNKCARVLNASCFTRRQERPRQVASACKECKAQEAREKRRTDPEAARAAYNLKRTAPNRVRSTFANALRRKYGMTLEDYARMLNDQDLKCGCCFNSIEPAGRHVHVDHCHATGTIRAILCSMCNHAVGNVGDDPGAALLLVDYLLRQARILEANGIVHLQPVPIVNNSCCILGQIIR